MQSVEFSKVKTLSLANNSYNKEACEWIAQKIIKNCDNIQSVNMDRLFSGIVQTDANDITILLEVLMDKKHFVSLNLSNNPIGLLTGIHLGRFIPKTSLKILNLTNCGLFSIDGETLAKEIQHNPNIKLTEFHAGKNRLEGQGIVALSNIFASQKILEKISLNENGCENGLVNIL